MAAVIYYLKEHSVSTAKARNRDGSNEPEGSEFRIGFRLPQEQAKRLQDWMRVKGLRRYVDLIEYVLEELPATEDEIQKYVEEIGESLKPQQAAKPRRSR